MPAGEVVQLDVDLGRMVAFQRGGTIIPKLERGVRSTECSTLGKGMTVVAALDRAGNATGMIYVDDGTYNAHEYGRFLLCRVSVNGGTMWSTLMRGGKLQTDPFTSAQSEQMTIGLLTGGQQIFLLVLVYKMVLISWLLVVPTISL